MVNQNPVAAEADLASLVEAVFRNSPDGIFITQGGRFLLVNHAYARMFGYDQPDELIGQPGSVLVASPEEVPGHLERNRRREAGEDVPRRMEIRVRRRDGTEFDIETQFETVELPSGRATLGVVRDVTDRKVAERELAESRERYRALFEVNTAVKLVIDPESGRILDANRAAVAFYGWPVEVLRTLRVQDLNTLPPEDVERELREARDGRRGYYRFRHRTATRGIRAVEVYTGPVDAPAGTVLVSIVHDVTDRERLEAEVRRRQKLDAIGRLAGGVAHEYNNLLMAMLGHAELLELTSGPNDHLRAVIESAERARELSRQLLAFTRRQALQFRRVGMDGLLRRMERLLRAAVSPSVELRLTLGADALEILADPGELEHAVLRLVLHARERTSERGVVRVETWSEADPGGGAVLGLRVVDDGPPVDPSDREQLFEPFGEGAADNRDSLALAAAYGVIRQSEGAVTLIGPPGGGLAVEVRFPAQVAAPAPPPPPRPAPRRDSGRVWVVDDEPSVRRVLRLMLERQGYEVTDFTSADEALDRLRRDPLGLDLLISDIVMPGRSGVELATAARALRLDLPILLISGDVGGHHSGRIPRGVQLLQKPFSPATLVDRLEELRSLMGRSLPPM